MSKTDFRDNTFDILEGSIQAALSTADDSIGHWAKDQIPGMAAIRAANWVSENHWTAENPPSITFNSFTATKVTAAKQQIVLKFSVDGDLKTYTAITSVPDGVVPSISLGSFK